MVYKTDRANALHGCKTLAAESALTGPLLSQCRNAGCIVVVYLFGTFAAYAEPHLEGGETRLKWAIAIMIIGAVVVGAVTVLFKKFAKLDISTWVVVAVSISLILGWTLFVGPVIVVIEAILITGRTM
jgi:hypothetical protein